MLTGIVQVDQSTLKEMLRFSITAGENLLTFGPAGTGKTEMAMQACAELGFEFCYLNLSVLEAPDLMGLPQIVNGQTQYALPRMLPQLIVDAHGKPAFDEKGNPVNGKAKVLLIDEADKAKPELQNPCLELLQFRSINGNPLNIHSCIATGNLPEEGAFSQPMSHALTNRCLIYRVDPSFEPWQEWAANSGVHPLIVGFLSRNQEFLLQPPPEGDDTAYCHPSPRAWTKAAKCLTQAAESGFKTDVNFQTLLIAGCVGQGAAVKFKVWLEHFRHIEPAVDRLVKDGTFPTVAEMGELDRTMVMALSACGAIMAETRKKASTPNEVKKQKETVEKTVKHVFSWMKKIPSEFSVGAVKSVLNMEAIKEFQMTNVPEFMDTYMMIRKAMKDGSK